MFHVGRKDPERIEVSSSMRTLDRATILAITAVLMVAMASPSSAVGTHTCSGFAPQVTFCQTGTFIRSSTISQDVASDVNYVGTLESVLVWSRGLRVFRCTYTQGLPRECIGEGEFPPTNTSFTHKCRSLIPGTSLQLTDDHYVNGQQGGVGTWSCSVIV